MHVLFLESHPMWIHGLPGGFCDLGHQVLVSGPLSEGNIPEMIDSFTPDLIFSMGWTSENNSKIKQKWINKAVKNAKIAHVYWATEDPRYTPTFSIPLIQTVEPDFVFTICPSRVGEYQEMGVNAARLDFGYHPSVHFPVVGESGQQYSVALVANAYPQLYREVPEHFRFKYLTTLIEPLLKEKIRVDIWGRNWNEMVELLGWDIPPQWLHDYLPYTQANKIYSSAAIVIGVQNLPTQLTQRTYEILGSGGFLLTNDTEELRRIFLPGQDLVATAHPEQTLQLVRYYLEHPAKRRAIQEQGRLAVAIHSYRQRAEYIINTLAENGILQEDDNSDQREGTISYYPDLLKTRYELYTVREGDTLWRISKNSGISLEELRQLNGLASDIIFPDQYLKIKTGGSPK